MAVIYPAKLPFHKAKRNPPRGEVIVYEALSRALSNDYHVLYGPYVVDIDNTDPYASVPDFVILHETQGVLMLEVKGGRIRQTNDGNILQYIPKNTSWKVIFPSNQVAEAARFWLRSTQKAGYGYRIPIRTCIMYPETSRANYCEGDTKLPDFYLFSDDIAALAAHIEKLMPYPTNGKTQDKKIYLDKLLEARRINKSISAVGEHHNSAKQARDKEHLTIKKYHDQDAPRHSYRHTRIPGTTLNKQPVKDSHPLPSKWQAFNARLDRLMSTIWFPFLVFSVPIILLVIAASVRRIP